MRSFFPHPLKPTSRAALFVAHPGHELRVHGWLELARPCVSTLTDGSGRLGCSRQASTGRILVQAGAQPLACFLPYTDAAIYDAILRSDAVFFFARAEQLAAALVQADVDYLVADAAEGYNPAHDICRAVADTAVSLVRQRGRALLNFDVVLEGRPDTCPASWRGQAIWLHLDEAALHRKLQAARSYPALAFDVDRAVRRLGVKAFRTECLRPVAGSRTSAFADGTPFYEAYGARLVAAGHYPTVLRYREHIAPLLAALHHHAEKSMACAR